MELSNKDKALQEQEKHIVYLEDLIVGLSDEVDKNSCNYITGQEDLIDFIRNSLSDMAKNKETTYSDVIVFLINLKPLQK